MAKLAVLPAKVPKLVTLFARTHRQIAGLGEMLVEPDKQVLDGPGLGEVFAEKPDCLGIGHTVTKPEP